MLSIFILVFIAVRVIPAKVLFVFCVRSQDDRDRPTSWFYSRCIQAYFYVTKISHR